MKLASGAGSATLKLEFLLDDASKAQHFLDIAVTSEWQEHSIMRTSNSNVVQVAASLVGESGGTVLFDEVSIVQGGTPPEGPAGNPLPGDITGGHNVSIEDVYVLAAHWADPNFNVRRIVRAVTLTVRVTLTTLISELSRQTGRGGWRTYWVEHMYTGSIILGRRTF